MPRLVGGVIWLLVPRPVPSSRSAARSISPYRLAGGMRAPFLSAHSPASFVGGWSYRFPFRLVLRLACSSRGASRAYSLRLACQSVLSRRFAGVSLPRFAQRSTLFRLARRSSISHLVRLLVPRLVLSVSLGRLVKQSVFFRFVRASRLDGSQGGSCSPSRSILFSSYPSVVSHDCWDGGGSSFSSRGGVLSSLLPPVVEFDWAMAVAEMDVPFDDTEGRAVFVSSISPSGKDDEGRYG